MKPAMQTATSHAPAAQLGGLAAARRPQLATSGRRGQHRLICRAAAVDPSVLQELIIGGAVVAAVASSLFLANRGEPKVCPDCGGNGGIVCFACGGSGKMKRSSEAPTGRPAGRDPLGRAGRPANECRVCKGSGKVFCRTCKGSGYIS